MIIVRDAYENQGSILAYIQSGEEEVREKKETINKPTEWTLWICYNCLLFFTRFQLHLAPLFFLGRFCVNGNLLRNKDIR